MTGRVPLSRSRLVLPRDMRSAIEQQREVALLARRHRPRDSAVRRTLAGADAIGVVVALLIALYLFSPPDWGTRVLVGVLTLPLWIVVFKAYGLYDRDTKRVSHTTADDFPWLVHALLVGAVGLWAIYKSGPGGEQIPFSLLLVFAGIALVNILALRSLGRRSARTILGPERVALLGDERMIAVLARKMRAHSEYGLDPIGIITTTPSGPPPALPSVIGELPPPALPPVIGELQTLDLPGLVACHRVERLVVSHLSVDEPLLLDIVQRCKEIGVKVSVLPQLFDAMGPSVAVDDVEGITVLGINPPVLSRSSRAAKRTMDLVGASVLALLTGPLLVVIAIAIKRDSPGPVFFRQQRIGRGGRRFMLLKFRTMGQNAEAERAVLVAQSEDPNWLKLADDPRVTRVGRWLRQRSLDELPQVWNVLKGEMSLVGPRPLVETEHEQIGGWMRGRIDLTPGLTGLWQVLGRTNIPFAEMVKLDYLYVTNWSLWNDVRLMLRTVPAVFSQRGAN